MTQNDPTDHALAAIASILDSKEGSLSHLADAAKTGDDHGAVVAERVTVTVERETVIAEAEAPATAPDEASPAIEAEHIETEHAEVDGYTRLGPGPLDAIRFRWTARAGEDGQYYVDETIGSHSRPVTSGPMPRREVIGFIDARERAARERFDALKRQMTIGRAAIAPADER